MIYDVAVIGYGVSGLCLASRLDSAIKAVFIEKGRELSQRRHDDAIDALVGCGGAGLFSDGKFSFRPAGSAIWRLDPKYLNPSCDILQQDLAPYLPDEIDFQQPDIQIDINDSCKRKLYPSYYISLANRLDLIRKLDCRHGHKVLYNCNVKSVTQYEAFYVVNTSSTAIKCRHVVFAAGRFGPVYFREYFTAFRHVEYGARIVARCDNPAMMQTGITDPKYLFDIEPGVTARTFCWCKNGEYVKTNDMALFTTYSGRSDVQPTNWTNFGLNVRVSNYMDDFNKLFDIKPWHIAADTSIEDINRQLSEIMPKPYAGYFVKALTQLYRVCPELESNCELVGPTVEGVGFYADVDASNLQLVGHDIHVIGDSGIARGIVGAMTSGYFVAEILNEKFSI